MILLALVACQSPAPPPVAAAGPREVVVRGRDIRRVTVVDPEGVPLVTRRLPQPVSDLSIPLIWPAPGRYLLRVSDAAGDHELPLLVEAPPLAVEVEAPLGQGRRPVRDGEAVPVVLVDGEPVQVAISVTALSPGTAALRIDGELAPGGGPTRLLAGERLVVRPEVEGPAAVSVRLEGERTASLGFRLEPEVISLEEASQRLSFAEVYFPADSAGAPDIGRDEGRVSLPSPWWHALTRRLGLGARGRDVTVPWAWYGVTLENSGERDINVVLRLSVVDEDGQPAAAFRPRLREGDDGSGTVQVLLRVPAGGRATGALPLFVDEALLSADAAAEGRWEVRLDALALGSAGAPLAQWRAPLYVSRGSTAASLGVVGALAAAAGGALLLIRRGPRWLAEAATSDLTTISLFGAMSFIVGAVGRLATAGLAAALGPFATLLTALADDTLRYTLLATLITLLPRPGTAALAVVTGWLLTGLALDGFSPSGLLYVAGRVLWLEGALYLLGLTRPTGWLDQPAWARWLRLTAAFGSASVLSSAAGLALSMALYRLYYADWYVALLLGGPGFLYVALAAAAAVPFADSLRRVQR